MRRLSLLLPLAMLGGCHQDRYAEAKALIAANCAACHVVPGVAAATGNVGPSLAGIAKRQVIAGKYPNRPDVMLRWLMHPQALVPGTAMPEMNLSAAQAQAIANYLYTLDK
jgi:cytochrome c